MTDDIATLERRLERGLSYLWDMEQADEADTPRFTTYLRHFTHLLAEYEYQCHERDEHTERTAA